MTSTPVRLSRYPYMLEMISILFCVMLLVVFEVMMGNLRSFRFLSQKANPRNKEVLEGTREIKAFSSF